MKFISDLQNHVFSFLLLRYGTGEHAPGFQHAGEGFYKCAYVSLLAHAKAYHIYNDEFRASQGGSQTILKLPTSNIPFHYRKGLYCY